MESRKTVSGVVEAGEDVEGMREKEKGFMDMDNSGEKAYKGTKW